ncbi:MAG: DUF4185 domain-containing protein [Planctomycetota bacterium]|jgi:hypothetical protein
MNLRWVIFVALAATGARGAEPPYPPSRMIRGITWHWETHRTAAPGSDLWPVTWGPDGYLYAAWGDGGGFGGTNSDGRVSMGFARIEGPPERFTAVNVNGGKDPENRASFPKKGKTGGMICVDGVLYARLNRQDGPWPDVNHGLVWSKDLGATWHETPWVFPKGKGNFKPSRFLNFGKDYTGVPPRLEGHVYLYGFRQADDGPGNAAYLGRVPRDRLTGQAAYEFWAGLDADDRPIWTADVGQIAALFTDSNGATPVTVAYNPVLERYLLCTFHTGPGQLGVFDAPQPWGPWTTVAYDESWGNMGLEGHGLNCDFPQKWMEPDGRTMWCIFSVYGSGAKQGVNAHDRFNLVKATLTLHAKR